MSSKEIDDVVLKNSVLCQHFHASTASSRVSNYVCWIRGDIWLWFPCRGSVSPYGISIRPGTDIHLSIPRSNRSGFGGIRSITRLPPRSVPKRSRSMPVLDHTSSTRSCLTQISEKSRRGFLLRTKFLFGKMTKNAIVTKMPLLEFYFWRLIFSFNHLPLARKLVQTNYFTCRPCYLQSDRRIETHQCQFRYSK